MKNTLLNIQTDVSLASCNTFKLPVIARSFVEIQSIEALSALYQHPVWETPEKLFLGSGSNILFAKDHFPGLVVKVNIAGITCIQENDQHAWIKAGGGENWHSLVRHSISQGYSGIENLSYIPGTAGAAPIQNIGAYGVELKDVLEELEAFHLTTGKLVTFKNHECDFGYRHSIFKQDLKNQYMICSITLKLNQYESHNIQYGEIQKTLAELGITQPSTSVISDIITQIRKNKLPDPTELPNVGSFFKNPFISIDHFNQLKCEHPELPHYPVNEEHVKVPAGWLIEKAGWKGKEQGHVGTYHKQALVIVNHDGKATGKAIVEFAHAIRNEIKQMFGIELVPEVTIIE